MGGRGATSGSSGLSATLKRTLGPIRRKKEDQLDGIIRSGQAVNPNYKQDGDKYTKNCQRVVYAYEMSRRGYNVEALAYQGTNDIMFQNGRWMHMFEGQQWEYDLGRRSSQVERNIEQTMADWGVGSRAIVRVVWKGGKKAHVFNVEQMEFGLMATDAQSGKVNFDISDYLNRAMPTKTIISRVDGLKPKDDMQYAMKRKERKQ